MVVPDEGKNEAVTKEATTNRASDEVADMMDEAISNKVTANKVSATK